MVGLLGWCVAQTACSSDDESSASTPSEAGGTRNAPSGAVSGNPSTSASGAAQGAATSGGSNTTNTSERFGQLLFASIKTPTGHANVLTASFYSRLASGCSSRQFGVCTHTPTCSTAYAPVYESAGTVTMSSTSPLLNVAIEPSDTNAYVSTSTATTLVGGEHLHFSATGGTIPAFSSDIDVSPVLLIDSPAADANGTLAASASEDLVIRFSRGGPGVQLYAQAATASGSLVCTSAVGDNGLTIPAAALATLDSGTKMSLWTLTSQVVSAGQFEITTGTLLDAYTPDKSHPVVISVE
jgi:hypothetical protein